MERFFGKPQNLSHPEDGSFNPGDAFIQRVCDEYGLYGAFLQNVRDEPIYLECDELLGLAAFVERNRVWLEEHVPANHEWFHNEVVGRIVSVRLRSKHDPDDQVVLSLYTENRFAWHGTPIMPETPEEELPADSENVQAYLRSEWEEYAERRQFSRPE